MKTANKKKISKKKETKNGRKLERETVSEILVFIRLRKKTTAKLGKETQ